MKEVHSVFRNSRMACGLWLLLSMLLVCAGDLAAQSGTARGVVRGSDGNPLAGVTIVVKGTSRGATTDMNGNYSIAAGQGDVLVFSFLGMNDQEVRYASQGAIDVQLQDDVANIDQIVVVGYGQQKKGSITGSIAQVRGEDLLLAPATNLTSVLAGRVTGLASIQQSGQPGADGAAMKIRGSNAPVKYFVDGIPRDNINEIDINEIENVSVLKDASALAVYGIEAQGGVVIVTTKRGQVERNEITYRGSYGVSLNTSYPEFLDGPGYAYWYNKALELDGGQPIFNKTHVEMMLNGDDSDGWANTDWFDGIFGTGTNQQHSLTMSGGNEKGKYFAALGYMRQTGNIENFDYDRYNARLNLDTKISRNLTFNMGLAGQIGDRRSAGYSAGGSSGSDVREEDAPWLSIAEQAAYSHPYLPRYYVAPEGASELLRSYNGLPVATLNEHSNAVNPVAATRLSGKNRSTATNIQSNASLRWDIPWVEGLAAKFTGSYDSYMTVSRNIATPYYLMAASAPTVTTRNIAYSRIVDARPTADISANEGLKRVQRITSQTSLEYGNIICNKHRFDALALMETRDMWDNAFTARGIGMPYPEIAQLDQSNGVNDDVGGAYQSHETQVGFIGRLVYEFDERYVIEASGRYDGSWKFAGNIPGLRWGFFPAAAVAWRLSNEKFIRDRFNFVDNLKLRVSYGELGSDRVEKDFAYMSTLMARTNPQVYIGNGTSTTWYTDLVANPFLTWERERQFDAGLEGTLWKGRLGFELDYFHKFNYDILATVPASIHPPSMGGYYPTSSNYNQTQTNGFDVMLSHNNRTGEFSYGVTARVSYAYTTWVRNMTDTPYTPEYQRYAGKQVGMYPGLKAAGLYQTEEDINSHPYILGRRPRLGDIRYMDMNGDGQVVHAQDWGFFGKSMYPTWTGSLNMHAQWRGFDASVMFTGAAGNHVRLSGRFANSNEDTSIFTRPFKARANAPRYLVENAWTPENTDAKYPRLSLLAPGNINGFASTFWYMDGKYLRLKNFQIGYTLPKSAVKFLGVENIRVFAEGSNVFTWTGLPDGFDPEMPSVAMGYYPQQRTFLGGVSVTF